MYYRPLVNAYMARCPNVVLVSEGEKERLRVLRDDADKLIVQDGRLFGCEIIAPPNQEDGNIQFFRR